jgi:iron complex outermembrane receptor protein
MRDAMHNLISQFLFRAAGLTCGLLLVAAGVEAAQAQTGTVRVEVVSAGAPVEGATVSVGSAIATTDASGVATITPPPGPAAVVAVKSGYQTAAVRIDVAAGVARTVQLELFRIESLVAISRTARQSGDQAVPVLVIGRDQIERGMIGAAGEIAPMFGQAAGLATQMTSPVMATTMVRMQGVPGRYTRLMSDGVPLFSDRPGGHAPVRIPPMDLDRIEVVKGPASSFYGSDALAGSINLLARRPGAAANREFLFSQSTEGRTDGVFWLSTPASGHWDTTFLAGGHWQDERDVNGDGWSDLPGYQRGLARPRVFWNNGKGRSVVGVADVTFEKREGGSDLAREALETKTAAGSLSGEMVLKSGLILGGAGGLFVQSRTRDFSDVRERERYQAATLELTLRRPSARHTWLAGIAADWYAIRSADALPSAYVSTRPGLFFQDDWIAAPWLVLSGTARLDYHNLYGFLLSPRGSVLMRNGSWAARVTASQGYFTPRPITEETEAAGLSRLTIAESMEVETARHISADVSHTTRDTALTFTVFRTQIDDPAQVDRSTYSLRTEAEPIVASGVELLGTARRALVSVTGMYTYARTRERDGLALALTPKHRMGLTAAVEGRRGLIGVEYLFTGEQRLDRNPYRTASESYSLVSLLGEARFGQWRLFVNADNLTDVRQTDWDPIERPTRDVDGRWTVDAWAPLAGRVINAGLRISF